jgi:hypothetical protein
MQRVRSDRAVFNARPFEGQGVSVYATVGGAVQYRALRTYHGRGHVLNPRHITVKGKAGQPFVRKTSRVASAASPEESLDWTLPAAYLDQAVSFDVRTYRDDVENESTAFRTIAAAIDAGGEDVTGILGTATLLSLEVRAGGIVRIRFVYEESRAGVQPTVFRAMRTAGPSSPASSTASYRTGQRLVEIDTPALLDSAPYTYKVRAENTAGTVTLDVLTGIAVQADASGPAAPTEVSTEAV